MTGVSGTGRSGIGRLAPLSRPRTSYWRQLDWVLVGTTLCLSLLGSLLVWSATRPRLIDSGDDPQSFLKRHLLNLAIGMIIGVGVSLVDYQQLRVYTPIMYAASCLGLVGVVLVGSTINGAHSWIVLGGGFQLQPSEFAKVALIVGLALLFAERGTRDDTRPGADVPLALGLAAVPMGLILLQPDVGTAMVFVFVIFGMFAVAGVSARWVLGLLGGGVLVGVAVVQLHLLQDYQLDRFRAFTNPGADAQGAAYNITQARIAIGSGGLTGTGLFKGTQTNGKFVPEQQTDFVFTVAGEEWGFLGAGGIILLLGLMLWRALRLAGRSPDMFGRLVAAGVASWFAFQSFINIGMTLGITPVTGLPLPFVSYGGSSMFANWIALGLLLNVNRRVHEAGPA